MVWAWIPLALVFSWVLFNFAGWAFCHWQSVHDREPWWRPEPFSWRIWLGPRHYYDHFYPAGR